MGRILKVAGLLGLGVALSACTSYVKTYDSAGNLIGSCVTRKGLFFGGAASCAGSANPKDQGKRNAEYSPQEPDRSVR